MTHLPTFRLDMFHDMRKDQPVLRSRGSCGRPPGVPTKAGFEVVQNIPGSFQLRPTTAACTSPRTG